MKGNIHKKLTHEDKFGRKYYCQRAGRFIKHEKKANSKKFRRILKIEVKQEELLSEDKEMYTKKDLDKQVNEDETLIQFIQNSHKEFYDCSISREEVERLSDKELNSLIDHLDDLWTK